MLTLSETYEVDVPECIDNAILKFFNRHDKDGNDLLNIDEALKFFRCLLKWASKKF